MTPTETAEDRERRAGKGRTGHDGQGGRTGRSELGTRFLFGPLMLLVVGTVFWLDCTVLRESGNGGVLTAVALGLLGLGAVHEFVAMFRKADHAVAARSLYAATVVLLASPFFLGWQVLDRELYPLVVTTLGLLFPVALYSLGRENTARGLEMQGGTMLGFLMIAWPLFFAQGMAFRHLPSLLFVVLVCKGGDIGGYFLGVAFGRHKLIPHVSGGKTVEGSLGSLLASIGLSCALGPLLLEQLAAHLEYPAVRLGLTGAVLTGIMLNLTTQTGDLIESLLKRRCGVKDSSTLLPAHGGILDLIDSLLFSFPAFFLLLVYST